MNKTKIEWTDYSWNPLTGCNNGCDYCYANSIFKRFGKSFKPTFHLDRLKDIDKITKPCKVFVCSVADLWGDFDSLETLAYVGDLLERIRQSKYGHITFQLLTKRPEKLAASPMLFPANVWVGTTVTNWQETKRIDDLRKGVMGALKFVSFEPLLSHFSEEDLDLTGIKWVIIGAMTGQPKSRLVKPKEDWIFDIVKECDKKGIPIYMKNSLREYGELRREFPTQGINLKNKGEK